jgi:hypothetical protein
MPQQAAKSKTGVIEAATHPDAIAPRIEANQGNEHQVQFAHRPVIRCAWFEDAERAFPGRAAQIMETHATLAFRDDPGQCNRAAALPCQRQQRGGIEFFRHGKVNPDVSPWLQPSGPGDLPRYLRRGGYPFGAGDRTSPRSQQLAQGSAFGVARVNWTTQDSCI